MSEMRKNNIIDQRGVFNRTHPLVDSQHRLLILNRNENGQEIKITRKDTF